MSYCEHQVEMIQIFLSINFFLMIIAGVCCLLLSNAVMFVFKAVDVYTERRCHEGRGWIVHSSQFLLILNIMLRISEAVSRDNEALLF